MKSNVAALTVAVFVIAVSAFAMPLERAEILAAGFDGYLVKPLRQLQQQIRCPSGCLEKPQASEEKSQSVAISLQM